MARQIAFQDWVQCLDRLFSGNGAYAKPYNHSSERAAALLPFLNHYNYHRPHFGINGCPRTQGSRETTDRDMTARHSGQDAATTRRGVLFSNFRFFQRESKNLQEEAPLIFRGRWDGAQIMLGYAHHEGARMA
jgi:hypothetical protein